MPTKDLTLDELNALVGTRHAAAGFEYPPNGLQPYYQWLMNTLHLLGEASLGALRVSAGDASDTSIRIAPGRATVSGVVLDFAGQTSELSAYNNDTAYVWLEDNAGAAQVGIDADATGWPGGAHLKLAEVTLVSGQITQILDRRVEQILSV